LDPSKASTLTPALGVPALGTAQAQDVVVAELVRAVYDPPTPVDDHETR